MKKLILMRHADAQPEQFGMNDRERCLSGDGMQELEFMRKKLQGKLQGLKLIVCSNVKRTRQTLEGIRPVLPSTCEATFDDRLYHAPVAKVIDCLHDLENAHDFVMLIAHNPGVSDFLNTVLRATQQATRLPKMIPTSGAAIFEGNFKKWLEASPAKFSLQELLIPTEG